MAKSATGQQGQFLAPEAADEALVRLAKIGGQVQGVSRMIREDRHCVEVLDQIASVQKALDGVSRTVMRNYLEQCVTKAIKSDDPLIYDELMKVLFRHR
ncbi:metal-sensitive transcriptional regulator [Streptomyces gobiensis]|uniref:metal-sensitive transcriptional regulator n=1 Tax=Streptomyces gobiensis TaxID=2875706 RepID=UPI001E4CC85B|nr:metal-sensitive transcriptional regulator [Streptomyces gobiensis]UGY91280.1 metal-sensitive transcriptional regulator [Streptomyces gobiensis]